MRKPEGVIGVAFGRVGAHGTRVVRMFAMPASKTEAARPADPKCPTDARTAFDIRSCVSGKPLIPKGTDATDARSGGRKVSP